MKLLDPLQRMYDLVGWQFLIDNLNTLTPYGIELKRDLHPYPPAQRTELEIELENVAKIRTILLESPLKMQAIHYIFPKFKEIRNSISRCVAHQVLDDIDFFEIKYCTIQFTQLVNTLNAIPLKLHNISFHSLEKIIDLLDPDGQIIPTFQIYSSYSNDLTKIRQERQEIEEKLHFASQNNKMKIGELKKKRLEIIVEEDKIEKQIRETLSISLREFMDILLENIKMLGRLDLLLAKADFAIKFQGTQPNIVNTLELHIRGQLHPWIHQALQKQGKSFTRLDIDLVKGVTLLTGANMGGKTITLKTTAFNLLLGLSGCFVCAQSASLPCIDHIFFISDDLQDVNRGLSTFGAEILYFQEIFSYLKDSQGILFIDEFARGTNPQEGQILVRSLCHFLHRQTIISFISTHYDNVGESSMSHYQVIGLRNMNFQQFKLPSNLNSQYSVDLIQDNMDYRIEKVDATQSVPRDALNIARILGFEEEIITYALQLYKGEKKIESSSTK